MLHNVKKNNIDLFEVHVHVSTSKYVYTYSSDQFEMYRRASTDMIIHVCTLGTPNY